MERVSLAECPRRLPSVLLLLALHLCVFTMFGMLLFTGEKVPCSALSPPGARGFDGQVGPVLQVAVGPAEAADWLSRLPWPRNQGQWRPT